MTTSDWTILFSGVKQCTDWLNEYNVVTQEELGLRILKVQEEAGEAATAWIGYVGQNPRKGRTHTKEQVENELVDVAVTALVALQSISGSAHARVNTRMCAVLQRMREREGGPPFPVDSRPS